MDRKGPHYLKGILLAATLASVSTVEARLGETPVAFSDRYGPAKKQKLFVFMEGAEVRRYERDGWQVDAAFLDIVSPAIRVEYRKRNVNRLSDEEVMAILGANAAGMAWNEKVYQDPMLKGPQIGALILAPALGFRMWVRPDGAKAWLRGNSLRLELPEAEGHDERIELKKIEKAKKKRPNF